MKSTNNTPDTIRPVDRIITPFHGPSLHTPMTVAQRLETVSGQLSNGASVPLWSPETGEDTDNTQVLPTFDACLRVIISAAERMMDLEQEPSSLAVAVAYDEALDIVTAAMNRVKEIRPRDAANEYVLDADRAVSSIRELLRPSPPVRRALQY
ncbi:hypothetical protein PsorP6_003452 [Peronosclerospora sorghi]|uniref:Uncharacterized protein n=1 Tax=Peronosclerospora sorghi TaxID=230839 RepID=A0ACC0VMZ8_9STRA|nr:hypothetical protein PsorP6_003452 [Peronosclerospora sorghi]